MIIPIFIICRDRFTVLKKSIESYKKLGEEIKIVIHDNSSAYPPLLDYYKELEKDGVRIYYNRNKGTFQDISDSIADTINKWYYEYSNYDAPYYIVSDPDIELESPSPELIQFYIKLLERHPQATCVGPMLKIDDLPDCFKFKSNMVRGHIDQFWDEKKHPRMVLDGVQYQIAAIDTTFAMYRKSFKFRRLNMGIRVHYPHMARHLDWYQDSDNLTPEEQYYVSRASDVSTLSKYNKQGFMG